MNPLISVIMPVWNCEQYVHDSVASILGQTFRDFELIIVDDGSTDKTLEIIEKFDDARIRLIRKEHAGIVSALSEGIAKARADIIARMDADDIAVECRFERQWSAFHDDQEAVLCFSAVNLIGNAPMGKAPHLPRSRALMGLKLCFQSPIVHSTVMFRKDAFLRCGGYREDERHAEDYGLWGRMLEIGSFCGVKEKLLFFRLHPESISQKKRETQKEVAHYIARRHGQRYASLSEQDSERMRRILNYESRFSIRDFVWLSWFCMPRFKWQSVEMWLWIVSQGVRRLLQK